MKTKQLFKIVFSVMMIIMVMWTKQLTAQTVDSIYMDNVSIPHVPYCQTSWDSIAIFAPAGVVFDHWLNGGSTTNPLMLASGYDGLIRCYYVGGNQSIWIHPVNTLVAPVFTDTTSCGSVVLDAGNYNSHEYTDYHWSNNETTQTITVGTGAYTVTVSNLCGTVISNTATVTNSNPTPPQLGPDTNVCLNQTIDLTPGPGYASYLWSTGANTETITVGALGGVFWVQTTNTGGGCVDYDTVKVTVLQPYSNQELCYVSKNASTNKNEIVFSETTNERISFYNIKKESSVSGVYNLIQSVPHTGTGVITVTDNTDNNSIQYTYNVTITDSCGNESILGGQIKPTYLTVNVDQYNKYTLSWLGYFKQNHPQVSTYFILSGNTFPLVVVDSVAGTIQNYAVPSTNTDTIFSVGVKQECASEKGSGIALSNNVFKGDATGINEIGNNISFDIYPNPVMDVVTVKTGEKIRSVELTDLSGRIVLASDQKIINCSILSPGVYFIKVIADNGVGVSKLIKK